MKEASPTLVLLLCWTHVAQEACALWCVGLEERGMVRGGVWREEGDGRPICRGQF